jgi:hypothetical protein
MKREAEECKAEGSSQISFSLILHLSANGEMIFYDEQQGLTSG